MQSSWTDSNGGMKRMTPILPIDFWNQVLKTKKVLNVKNKEKKVTKERKKKSCSCQVCGRVTSVKTPPYHRASSPWAYMRIFTPLL